MQTNATQATTIMMITHLCKQVQALSFVPPKIGPECTAACRKQQSAGMLTRQDGECTINAVKQTKTSSSQSWVRLRSRCNCSRQYGA
jgi:hypothetical protein